MMRSAFAVTALALAAAPLSARVDESGPSGFTVSSSHVVNAAPSAVWAELVTPALWWSPMHSWSGSASNFSLDARAGGCFCEIWGESSVEHGRVVYAAPGELLRIRGSLGPLQGEALTGVLTVTLKAQGQGTRIDFAYVVGGHARFDLAQIAPDVDSVIGEQAGRLAALFPAGR